MSTARDRITAGATVYVLTADGAAYEPEHARGADHRWRHHTDKKSGKLYFSHSATGKVEWTLPDIGANSSNGGGGGGGGSPDGPRDPEVSALTVPSTSHRRTPSGSDLRASIQARIQERLRASRSPSPAVTPDAALAPTPEAVPAVRSGLAAPSSPPSAAAVPTPATTSPPKPTPSPAAIASAAVPAAAAEGSSHPVGGGDVEGRPRSGSAWRERLQRHRARTHSPAQRPTNLSGSFAGDDAASNRGQSPFGATGSPGKNESFAEPSPTDAAMGGSPLESTTPAVDATNNAPGKQPQQSQPDAFDKKLKEERRAMIAAQDAQLQQERMEVLRAERLAMDRQRVAAEEAARAAAEHAKIVQERRALEERRAEIERERLAGAERRKAEDAARAKAATAGEIPDDDAVAAAQNDADGAGGVNESAVVVAHRSADAKIRASHEFASALSLAILEDLQDDVPDVAAPAVLEEDVKRLKRATIEYAASHKYTGTIRGKQKHGRGRYSFDGDSDAYFYEGEWVADKKHGSGVVSLARTVYEGGWKEDRPSGKGLLQTKHVKASANFSNGVAHGNTVAQMSTGESFGGKVQSAAASTPGALTLSSSDRIEWRSADPSRPGTGSALVAYASGDSFSGAIQDWQLHGDGRYFFGDTGDVYVGTFASNEMTGKGTYTFAEEGGVYDGAVVKGLFEGRGRFVLPDMTYDGEWTAGKMHGRGTITYANGDVWRGVFDNDRRSKGKYVFSKAFALA